MPVKILHGADFHIDSPFDSLPEEKASQRRREQRALLEKIAKTAKEQETDIVLLSGDLFDSDVSYFETCEILEQVFSSLSAHVFIAPGNHDYYCHRSPYAHVKFPENVHIFKSPAISYVDLPELPCRVWGAGFNTPLSESLLNGFKADNPNMINIMTIHGDLGGETYNHISTEDIAASGLDYLALGHVHTFSGFLKAGKTVYAYPGCPEGRGFDETGEKGIIVGAVSKNGCDLQFMPLGGREYKVLNIEMTAKADPIEALKRAIPENADRDIFRVIFTGEYDTKVDLEAVAEVCGGSFFHATFKDKTVRPGDMWQGLGENSLRGVFLEKMRGAYENASDDEKSGVEQAVRYGLAALDRREDWRP